MFEPEETTQGPGQGIVASPWVSAEGTPKVCCFRKTTTSGRAEGMGVYGDRRTFQPIPDELEETASDVLDAAFAVHSKLGPGLLESVYQAALLRELADRSLQVEAEVDIPVRYEGEILDVSLRLDILVEDRLILELKAADDLHEKHTAQLLTYLKATGRRLGFLLNFGAPHLREGVKRVVL